MYNIFILYPKNGNILVNIYRYHIRNLSSILKNHEICQFIDITAISLYQTDDHLFILNLVIIVTESSLRPVQHNRFTSKVQDRSHYNQFPLNLLKILLFHNSSVEAIGAFNNGVLGLFAPSEFLVAWKSSFDKDAGIGAIFN